MKGRDRNNSLFLVCNSQPTQMDRPLANECNNYSSPRYLSTWANRGPGPTSSSGVEKEEDPGFPGNHILACVDSYSERVFTMYSIYMHTYIQKVFLLQCFPFYKAVLWYPLQHPSSPAVGQGTVPLSREQCNMSALYGLKPKDEWSIQKLDI